MEALVCMKTYIYHGLGSPRLKGLSIGVGRRHHNFSGGGSETYGPQGSDVQSTGKGEILLLNVENANVYSMSRLSD